MSCRNGAPQKTLMADPSFRPGADHKTPKRSSLARTKRDTAYFAERLEREHPEIWAAWKADAFPSLRAACVSAGLIRRRSRASELKNAWQKATVDEKFAFLNYLRNEGILRRAKGFELAVPPRRSAQVPLNDVGRTLIPTFPWKLTEHDRLTPEAKERILDIMRRRELILPNRSYRVGVIMEELGRGFKSQDPSLSHALKAGWRIRPELAKALEKWLVAQENNKIRVFANCSDELPEPR
jgi:hypothetical protein